MEHGEVGMRNLAIVFYDVYRSDRSEYISISLSIFNVQLNSICFSLQCSLIELKRFLFSESILKFFAKAETACEGDEHGIFMPISLSTIGPKPHLSKQTIGK